ILLGLWRHRLAEFLLGGGERVRLNDEVRCDGATAVDDSSSVGLEPRPRLARGVTLERIRVHFDELTVRRQLPLLLDGAAARRIPLRRRHLECPAAVE